MEKELTAEEKAAIEALSFEEAVERLDTLVSRMEQGRQPLETMLSDYEKGSLLLAHCRRKLEGMRRRIEILEKAGEESASWREFDASSAAPSRQ